MKVCWETEYLQSQSICPQNANLKKLETLQWKNLADTTKNKQSKGTACDGTTNTMIRCTEKETVTSMVLLPKR